MIGYYQHRTTSNITMLSKLAVLSPSSSAVISTRGAGTLRSCCPAAVLLRAPLSNAVSAGTTVAVPSASAPRCPPKATSSVPRQRFQVPTSPIYPKERQRSLFHSSPTASFPERRRRKGAGPTPSAPPDLDAEDEDDERSKKERHDKAVAAVTRHEPVTDPARFREASDALLEKLYQAIKPMGPPVNKDPFVLTRGTEDDVGDFLLLDLGPVKGQYTVQVDNEQCLVVMRSPLSGQIAYVLSARTGEWCGQDDGHALEGMLVRDLIRQCNGVPNL